MHSKQKKWRGEHAKKTSKTAYPAATAHNRLPGSSRLPENPHGKHQPIHRYDHQQRYSIDSTIDNSAFAKQGGLSGN